MIPKKANNLVHKPVLKGGAMKSTATVVVKVCGHKKSSVKAQGSNPVFTDTIEFILGTFPLSRDSTCIFSGFARGISCMLFQNVSNLHVLHIQREDS